MASRTLEVQIIGDSKSLENAFGRSAKSAETSFGKISKAATIAGAAILGGLAVGAKIGFDELREGQAASAQTAAALKSTGGAAKVTQKQIEDLAESLSRMSGVDDEVIQGSENVLLAFTNVRNEVGKGNDVFDRATKVILDYSVRTGRDATSAARQFGKALQDPVKYAGSLARAGVVLSDQQKKLMKTLTDAGKPMEAQKVLLSALEEGYGGAAKAAGDTLTGQMNKAKEAFRETAANLTTALLPAITAFLNLVVRLTQYLQEHTVVAKALVAVFGALGAILLTVGAATKIWAATQAVIAAGTAAWTAAQWLLNAALTANPIGVVVVAIAALVAGLVLAYQKSETFRAIVQGALKAVQTAAEFLIDFFRNNWKIIAAVFLAPFLPIIAAAYGLFKIKDSIIAAANAIIDFFRSNWKTIAVLISGPFYPLVALATDAFGIRSAMVGAFNAIRERVSEVIGDIMGILRSLAANAGKIVQKMVDALKTPIDAGVALFQRLLDIINAVKDAVAGVLDAIANIKIPSLPKLPGIPGFAGGVKNFGGGYAVVGERGPELVQLPRGSDVIPMLPGAGISAGGGGTGSLVVNVYGSVTSERDLVTAIRNALIQQGRRNGGNILGGYA